MLRKWASVAFLRTWLTLITLDLLRSCTLVLLAIQSIRFLYGLGHISHVTSQVRVRSRLIVRILLLVEFISSIVRVNNFHAGTVVLLTLNIVFIFVVIIVFS